jgi:hypothetical protein
VANFTGTFGFLCFPRSLGSHPIPQGVGPLVSHTLSPSRSLGAVMCGVAMAMKWGQGT